MAQKHTAVEVKDTSGNHLRAISQETDYPIPPAEELRRLHEFRPDLVDKAVEMMEQESINRRRRADKIDRYIHVQNMTSSIGSILIAIVAFSGSIYLAATGHEWAAVGIVGSTLGTVIYAINKQNK